MEGSKRGQKARVLIPNRHIPSSPLLPAKACHTEKVHGRPRLIGSDLILIRFKTPFSTWEGLENHSSKGRKEGKLGFIETSPDCPLR